VFHALYRITTRYRFHERGLTRSTLLGDRTMLYGQVESMTWRETVTMINHAIAIGTTMKIRLAGAGEKPLQVKVHRFRGTDADLEPVRRAIAHNIALRLRQTLEREGRVAWTRDATFLREGLEVKTGLLGNKPALLPYDQPLGVQYSGAYLNIHRDTWRKPFVLLDARAENFYPGLTLFGMLMQRVNPLDEEHIA